MLKVGVLGAGHLGKIHLRLLNQSEKYDLVGFYDPFEENANKKDSVYWNAYRPVPLTLEESNDYVKKDSLQTLRKSEKYLDSIDAKGNKFKIFDIITGYTYKKSMDKWSFNYAGISDLASTSYNTVQGWNLNSGFSFRHSNIYCTITNSNSK